MSLVLDHSSASLEIHAPFAMRLQQAIDDMRRGHPVLLVDDFDRENEADLIVAAERITTPVMAMLIRECSGIVCLCLDETTANRLELPLMVSHNGSRYGTAFTVSIEARQGVSTGVSAQDRVTTIRAAIAKDARPSDLVHPGHVFPLRAQHNGVLARRGHTEGAVDLAVLAGLQPRSVLCELTNPDGSMSKGEQILNFARQHKMTLVSIDELAAYRKSMKEQAMTDSKSNVMADNRPQNIYDDSVFFAGYKDLRQNDTGLNGALEVPALRRLLPDLHGKLVLDLGCGFGDFARYARDSGAASVTAVDVSANMLDEAKRLTHDSGIAYLHCAIEDYVPEPNSFDLAVSSMALHYIADYRSVVLRAFSALRSGGRFVFSVEHPVCTANPFGWILDERGQEKYWPLGRYQEEGERSTRWFVHGVLKYHRTLATYVDTLLAAGFRLEYLDEPQPTTKAMETRPELQLHCHRPPVLLLACTHP